MENNNSNILDRIIVKFKDASIEFEQRERERVIAAQIKSGRDKFTCHFRLTEDVMHIMDTCDFQDFNFIKGYEAIWSNKRSKIECELHSNNIPTTLIIRAINDILNPNTSRDINYDRNEREIERVEIPFQDPIKVEIGVCSNEFALLTHSREKAPMPFRIRMDARRRTHTLTISNIPVETHDTSSENLIKIANSIFFQLDVVAELSLTLRTERESHEERRKKDIRRRTDLKNVVLDCPKYEYDSIPISLYWYAKSNLMMPLFQFLAFYQVIEYYYPIYSNQEAKKKISNLLKSPKFNANKDEDIVKLLTLIKVTSGGKSFGSEREQLKSTISQCFDNQKLKDFLEADDERKEFYTKNKSKDFVKQKVSLGVNADIISEICERIYEIRCKIVHTKSNDEEFEIILPYSPNVKKLLFDIELVEYIARELLIINSSNLIIK